MHMISKIKDRDKLRGDNILKYFPEWTLTLRMNIMEVLHRIDCEITNRCNAGCPLCL